MCSDHVTVCSDRVTICCDHVTSLLQLQMMGYDISWAAFNVIEVMSSTKFTYKVMTRHDYSGCGIKLPHPFIVTMRCVVLQCHTHSEEVWNFNATPTSCSPPPLAAYWLPGSHAEFPRRS